MTELEELYKQVLHTCANLIKPTDKLILDANDYSVRIKLNGKDFSSSIVLYDTDIPIIVERKIIKIFNEIHLKSD